MHGRIADRSRGCLTEVSRPVARELFRYRWRKSFAKESDRYVHSLDDVGKPGVELSELSESAMRGMLLATAVGVYEQWRWGFGYIFPKKSRAKQITLQERRAVKPSTFEDAQL